MIVNRITDLNIENRGIFTAVYGKTDDVFLGPDMRCYDLSQQLYLYLKSCDFNTVVFYDRKNLYHSYSENDLLLFQKVEEKQKTPPRYKARFKTPLRGTIRLDSGNNHPSEQHPTEETAHRSIMMVEREGDTFYRLRQTPEIYAKFGGLFQSTQTKVALIVKSPSNVQLEPSHLFDDLFNGIRNQYKKRNLGHKIIVLYHGDDVTNFVEQFSQHQTGLTFFTPLFRDAFLIQPKTQGDLPVPSANCFHLGLPDASEISSFLHYRRLVEHVRIDFTKFNQLLKNLHIGKGRKKWTGGDLRHISQSDIDRLSESIRRGAAMEKLENLTGLQGVKSMIKTMLIDIKAHQQRAKLGLTGGELKIKNLNFVFTGNPGTGKTTVANLLGEILADIGILQEGHSVVTKREDLVAGYVGQTAIKTQKKIEEALNGVFFIDEAHSLVRGGENDFGREVIEQLVAITTHSDYNGNMAFIVAGYPDKMEQFIASDPGLPRRFSRIIHFDDYSSAELVMIFEKELIKNYKIGDGVLNKANAYFDSLTKDENFGNAGVAVELAEKVISNLNSRLSAKDFQIDNTDEWITIEQEDLPGMDAPRSLADEVLPIFNPSNPLEMIIRNTCDEVQEVLFYVIAAFNGEVDFTVPLKMLEEPEFQQKVQEMEKHRHLYAYGLFEEIVQGMNAFRLFFKGVMYINTNDIENAILCFSGSYEIACAQGIDGLEQTTTFLMKYWKAIFQLKESDFKDVHQKLLELREEIGSSGVNEHFKQMSDLMQADLFFISALNAISQDDTQRFGEFITLAADNTDKAVDEYFGSDSESDAKWGGFLRSAAGFYRAFGDMVILFKKVDENNFDLTAELVSLDIHIKTAQSYLRRLDLAENARISNIFYMIEAFVQFREFLKELSVVMLNYNNYRQTPNGASVATLKNLVAKAQESLRHIQDAPVDPWIDICNSMIEYVENIGSETLPTTLSKGFGQLGNNFKGLMNDQINQTDTSDPQAVKTKIVELMEEGETTEAITLLRLYRREHIKDKRLSEKVLYLINRFFENRNKWDVKLITHEHGSVDENQLVRSLLIPIISKL